MPTSIRFHLPTRRQFTCLSSCASIMLLAFGIPLILLLIVMNNLPSLADYLEQFETYSVLDLGLKEIHALDDFNLQIDRIDSHAGSFDVTVIALIGGLPIQSVKLSANQSLEGSATFADLPRGYTLRLLSASQYSVRLQIFPPIPIKET